MLQIDLKVKCFYTYHSGIYHWNKSDTLFKWLSYKRLYSNRTTFLGGNKIDFLILWMEEGSGYIVYIWLYGIYRVDIRMYFSHFNWNVNLDSFLICKMSDIRALFLMKKQKTSHRKFQIPDSSDQYDTFQEEVLQTTKNTSDVIQQVNNYVALIKEEMHQLRMTVEVFNADLAKQMRTLISNLKGKFE